MEKAYLRTFAMLRLQMRHQRDFLRIRHRTVFTLVRFLVRMLSHVHFTRIWRRETLITVRTDVGPLARMHLHVSLVVSHLFPAHRAHYLPEFGIWNRNKLILCHSFRCHSHLCVSASAFGTRISVSTFCRTRGTCTSPLCAPACDTGAIRGS